MVSLTKKRTYQVFSRFLFVLFIYCLLISITVFSSGGYLLPEFRKSVQSNLYQNQESSVTNYTLHSPLSIVSDDHFHQLAEVEGWPGNGTEESPYLLSRFLFTGTDLMFSVRDTQVFFTLSNCLFNGDGPTIKLYNVNNGNIEQNIIGNSTSYGIIMERCQKVTVTNNTIQFSQMSGMYLFLSHYNTIDHNAIFNSGEHGIELSFSDDNHFLSNEITGNAQNGIEDTASSDANDFINNIVTRNIYGLRIRMSNSNRVLNNSFCLNDYYGVEFDSSFYTLIHWNNFIFNHQEPDYSSYSQARDSGIASNSTNEFSFNYWSNWDSPDNNSDGFIDLPYLLEGSNENNYDSFPLSSPNNFSRDLVTKPRLTHPSGGDIVSSVIYVHWVDSRDWLGYNLFYSLSYSQDDGDTWILIESEIAISLYQWDTFTLPDGSYRLQVIANCPDTLTWNSDSTKSFIIENAIAEDTTIIPPYNSTSPLQNSSDVSRNIFLPLINLNPAALLFFLVILGYLLLSLKPWKK